MADVETFSDRLLRWHSTIDRQLPWKETTDPYLIWISEIVMQQTRVEQGTGYYLRLTEAYPTVHDLAAAPEDELMLLWQGLGYYSRARNLHKAATLIVEEYGGVFPTTYDGVLSLPGVGPYTAAAICSFAYELPHAVVDGNVYRVLSRFFGIDAPIDTGAGQRHFREMSQRCLGDHRPSEYNQAIMDFGALHCTPKKPKCSECLLIHSCSAYREDRVFDLPVKSKKIKRRNRYLHYFYIVHGDHTYVKKRTGKGIWQGLYELPLVETVFPQKETQIFRLAEEQFDITEYSAHKEPYTTKHVLSHQDLMTTIYTWHIDQQMDGYQQIPIETRDSFAFPVLLERFFTQLLD